MNGRKSAARVARRRKAFAEVECNNEKYRGKLGDRPGFKWPGSNKKPFPEGKSSRESRRRGRS